MKTSEKLKKLWARVDTINRKNFSDNGLVPICGNGKVEQPKVMFVFINPTIRNISASPDWKGVRFPFIGTKNVWRFFNRSGFFDDELLEYVNTNSAWSCEFDETVLRFLCTRELYIAHLW